MSINRIDFQGAFLNTGEQNIVKNADAGSRVAGEQAAFQTQFAKEKVTEQQSVQQKSGDMKEEHKFDAREKGKNEYFKREKKDKKDGKDSEEADVSDGVYTVDGRPAGLTHKSHSFDFKV